MVGTRQLRRELKAEAGVAGWGRGLDEWAWIAAADKWGTKGKASNGEMAARPVMSDERLRQIVAHLYEGKLRADESCDREVRRVSM